MEPAIPQRLSGRFDKEHGTRRSEEIEIKGLGEGFRENPEAGLRIIEADTDKVPLPISEQNEKGGCGIQSTGFTMGAAAVGWSFRNQPMGSRVEKEDRRNTASTSKLGPSGTTRASAWVEEGNERRRHKLL